MEQRATEPVMINLTLDEALVLFECLARSEEPDGESTFADPQEQLVLWSAQAQLEKVRVEPFRADFDVLLRAARERMTAEKVGK